MNKAELIDAMVAETGLMKKDVKAVVESFVNVTTKELKKKDGRVCIPGFITATAIQRPARKGRNVRTGAVIKVPAKRVVKFKAGSTLAEAIKK